MSSFPTPARALAPAAGHRATSSLGSPMAGPGPRRAWDRCRRGRASSLGRRSAVRPPSRLAAVVILADGSELKEERSRPGTRDLAARRAGAAAPPHPLSPRSAAVRPPARADPGSPHERPAGRSPAVIDRRQEPPALGLSPPALSPPLRACGRTGRAGARANAYRNGTQTPQAPPASWCPAICVLNRKGRARLLACGRPAAIWPARAAARSAVSEAEAGRGVAVLACRRMRHQPAEGLRPVADTS